MSKQLHIRLEDNVFDELSDYANENGQSVQNCVSGVLIRMLSQQKSQKRWMPLSRLLTCLLVLAECELHSITLVVTACIPANGTNTANRLTWLILANSQKAILLR